MHCIAVNANRINRSSISIVEDDNGKDRNKSF